MSGFAFGSSAPAPASTFGSFGAQQPTAAPTNFAFGTPAKGGFGTGFGTTMAPTAPNFSFGTTTAAPGLFGTGSAFPGSFTTTIPATTGQFGTGLGSFGSSLAPSNNLGGLTFGSNFTSQPGLQQAAANVNNEANLAAALSLPSVFGDERDAILAKWNQLQAFWGTGKGYFISNSQPVEFSPENPFCRFKAIGYSCLPTAKSEEGLVGLNLKKKESEVRSQQQHLVAGLHKLFNNNPNLTVCVDGIKSIPGDKTEVVIYLQERTATGLTRRIPTNDVVAYLEQPTIKAGLGGLSVLALVPKAALSMEQLKNFLDHPLTGIDPLLWQQAKLDNPDPTKLIPTAMTGFSELLFRLQCQEQENKQHQERLDLIAEEIASFQKKHAVTLAKITEYKRKQLELGHRVLKVMVNQEVRRKLGFAIQAEEEQLRVQLEAMQTELSAPTQFRGRLNELLSQIRMQNHQQVVARSSEHYGNLDSRTKEEFQQFLNYQQEGIAHLVNFIKEDLDDLNIIKNELKEIVDGRR